MRPGAAPLLAIGLLLGSLPCVADSEVGAGAEDVVESAESLFGEWEFTGFGTLGYAQADKYDDLILKRNITQRSQKIEDHPWLVDSRLGLQVRKEVNSHWDTVAQLVIQEKVDNSLENSIEMAFVRYQSDDQWSLRFGRMALDTFLLSDHRNAGYSYHWVRPPTEFYGWIPFSYYDGVKAVMEFGDFSSLVRLEVFAGRTRATVNIGYQDNATSQNYVKASPVFGGGVTWEQDDLELRAYLAQFEFTQDTNAIIALQEAVANPAIQAFWPGANEIAEAYTIKGKRLTYGAVGFAWNPSAWVLQGEVSAVDAGAFGTYDGQRAYLMVGHRFGAWLPHLTWSYSWDEREFPYPPPPPVPEFEVLYGIMTDSLSSGTVDQNTVSLGLRWDFATQKALKLQVDYTTLGTNSLGIFPTPNTFDPEPRYWPADARTWVSATFDWVF